MAEPSYDARPLNIPAEALPEPVDDVVELTPQSELTPEEKHRQLMLFVHTVKLVVALVLLPILLFKIL